MAQTWHDLLFAHWPVDAATMRTHVPRELELDTFDGAAWLGVVPFRMSGLRLRGLPGLPGVRTFPELNLRTYVTRGDRPGVWFFSLDAASPIAVAVARAWFDLPYFRARMRSTARGDEVEYASERTHPGAAPAAFRGTYGPSGPVQLAHRGTLEHWLTERYCLYARSPGGSIRRGEIHHAPWPLQSARARIAQDTIAQAEGFPIPARAPHLLFARRIDVRIWAPVRVDREARATSP
jgi:uncharacterized protein YqjF (DUF2071 family)